MATIEQAVVRKVSRRLIPFLIFCYFVAYIDRVNVGFAALTMNRALGFTPVIYAWGAGIFFIGYLLFEVPSNVILERIGARIWIARIMVSWGFISLAMAFVWDTTSFYVARFLLGVAEAGFFPGIILYLTYWFPAAARARIVGVFMVAVPISTVIGAPLSGWILGASDGLLGLQGWQWLFITEALPSVLGGFVAFSFLTDRPDRAHWLTAREQAWLTQRMDAERTHREAIRRFTLGQALVNPRVLALGLVYMGIVTGLYGINFWLPQIVDAFGGLSTFQVGLITAIPFLAGAAGMIVWSRHSDRTGERLWHVILPSVVGALGFAGSAYLNNPILAMAALSFAGLGIFAALPTFWTLPTSFLTGTAAAGGIALINSVGNLGGFAGPYVVGWIRNATGEFRYGMLFLAAALAIAAIITRIAGHSRRERRGAHA